MNKEMAELRRARALSHAVPRRALHEGVMKILEENRGTTGVDSSESPAVSASKSVRIGSDKSSNVI